MAMPKNAASPLNRRAWLNLALFAIVIGLAVVVWLAQRAGRSEAKPSLLASATGTVSRIELQHTGRSKIIVTRASSDESGSQPAWRMQEPVAARVNPVNVEALLALGQRPVVTELPFSTERLAAFGLEHPQTEIRYDTTSVFFGARHPFEDQIYARRGDRLFLISASSYRVATLPYSNFIDTQLLEPGRQLSALRLPGFQIRKQNGTWKRIPAVPQLGADDINRFIDQWRNARALTVQRATGGRALRHIRLQFEDGSAIALDVLAEQPEFVLYRKDENLTYHFPATVGTQLLTLAPAVPAAAN